MKSALLAGSVSMIIAASLVLSGCNSGDVEASLLTDNGNTAVATPTVGCTVTATAGGATIACSDGTQAVVTNGTAGTNGIAGIVGVTGATGASASNGVQYRIKDKDGIVVGTKLMSFGSMGTASWFISDDVEATAAEYLANGVMRNGNLYYADSLCATTPMARYEAQGTVFKNFAARWVVSQTTYIGPPVVRVKDATTGTCGATTGSGDYSRADAYTGSLPISFPTPARLEQF